MKALNTIYFSNPRPSPFRWCLLALLFFFSVNVGVAQIENDDCSDAIALVCGDVVSGNNDGADTESLPSCGLVFPGQTVWYSIVGTGGDITASTCSANTDFDTQIGVFSGSCGSLSCVAGNNNDTSCENPRYSTVTWASDAGTTYYIAVAGVLGAEGDFELSIECEVVGPENDDCADALPIGCDQTVFGSTTGASSQSLPFCGTSLSSGPGVWYAFVGNGAPITVTTCGAGTNYDTKLGVFTGSCGSFSCVGGDDDEFGCGFSFLQSEVNFSSTAGTTYYIYVTGFSSSNGEFELTLSCGSPLENDDVCDAIPLSLGVTPFDLTGASAQSGEVSPGPGTGSSSCNSQDGWCSFETDVDASIWYTFVAPASGCVSIVLDGGDSQIAIWSVGDCDDFSTYTEVAANDDGGPGLAAGLEDLLLTPGETYYLQVDDFGGPPTVASGDITYSESSDCDFPPPSAPTCEEATEVFCGDSVAGDTGDGNVNDFGSLCGPEGSNNLSTGPGLWYRIEGNNSLITLNTCNDVLDFDVHIGVFSGSCDDLTCEGVSSNLGPEGCEFFFGRADEITFEAFSGVTYYIYVTGVVGANGNFQMDVDCAPLNDNCSGAISVECGSSVSGNTDDASSDIFPACGTSNFGGPGLWYTVTGTGNELTASTCNPGSNYDTKLFVFEGTCGALSCIDGNDDDFGCSFSSLRSSVSWDSDEGVTYYVLVTGFSSFSSGDFELSITGDCGGDPPPPPVDLCYTEIGCGETVSGSTVGEPTYPEAGFCGTTLTTAGGVWYSFLGNGDDITVTTCNAGSNYDTKLGVFTGDCTPNDLVCVGGNDDATCSFSGLRSTVTFASTDGQEYFIFVTGFGTATGNFELSLTCSDPGAPIPACENAPEITCGETVSGSTIGEPIYPEVGTCGTALTTAPGVWYYFVGTGDNVTVTTCNAGTNYDTKLGVFTGSCTPAGLSCVGGNDDDFGCGFSILRSTVTFGSTNGQDYFIFVSGFGSNSGSFELSVDCNVPLNNDDLNTIVNPDLGNTLTGDDRPEVGNLYPNPSQVGDANVQIKATQEGEGIIQVFDQVGRLAHRTEVDLYQGKNNVAMQLNQLPAGTYIVNITLEGEVFNRKFVITKGL